MYSSIESRLYKVVHLRDMGRVRWGDTAAETSAAEGDVDVTSAIFFVSLIVVREARTRECGHNRKSSLRNLNLIPSLTSLSNLNPPLFVHAQREPIAKLFPDVDDWQPV